MTIITDSDGQQRDIEVSMYATRDPLGTPAPVTCEIDPYGPWLVTIDQPHHQVHEGETFTATAMWTGVGSGTSKTILMRCGGNVPHATFEGSSDASFFMELFESPTYSACGTAVAKYNRNRASGKTGTASLKSDPTLTACGTLLHAVRVGGGNTKIGGTDRSAQEWILNPSNEYLLRITSGAAGSNMTASVSWYEEGTA